MRGGFIQFSIFIALVLTSCSHVPHASTGRDRNVITTDEISRVSATTAWDIVVSLRPTFLRSRGQASFNPGAKSEPTVFLENVEVGGPASLKQIQASQVAEIRFIEGWDTEAKFGPGFRTGIIQVLTRLR